MNAICSFVRGIVRLVVFAVVVSVICVAAVCWLATLHAFIHNPAVLGPVFGATTVIALWLCQRRRSHKRGAHSPGTCVARRSSGS